MIYFKAVLSAIAAIFLALFGPQVLWSIRHASTSGQTATGLGVFAAELVSPLFWLLAAAFFVMFFFAAQIANKAIRIVVFWIPASFITAVGSALVGFISYILVLAAHRR